jgi:hypothetical protein
MATAVVTIICIAIMIMGGVILTQGILNSADATAISVEDITLREGELTRTSLEAASAAELSWPGLLRVTVYNNGQTKLAGFEKWDVIVDYTDDGGTRYTRRLPYTGGELAPNQWRKARIGLDGPVEFFEPNILNPEEELVILARPDPPPGAPSTGGVTITADNGAGCSAAFSDPGYVLLVPLADNTTLAAVRYYQLEEDATPQAAGTIMAAEFAEKELGDKVLCDENEPDRQARHIFPLVGIDQIPAATWTIYYHCRTSGGGNFPRKDGDVSFYIEIIVRKADGTLRQVITSNAAPAYFPADLQGNWTTISGNYTFPSYEVVDENDYLEVVYHGHVERQGPSSGTGYVQLDVDNGTLPPAERTRIES